MNSVINWIVRNAMLIVLITVILGGGAFIWQSVKDVETVNGTIGALENAAADLRQLEGPMSSLVTNETQSVVGQSLAAQRRLLADVNRDIDGLLREAGSRSQLLLSLAVGDGRDRLRAHVRLELRQQQRRYLEVLIRHTAALQEAEAARKELERLWHQHKGVYSALEVNRAAQELLREEYWEPDWNPLSDGYDEMQQLKAKETLILRDNKAAYEAYQQQKAILERKSLPTRPEPFRINAEPINELSTAIEDEIRRLRDTQDDSVVAKAVAIFAPKLSLAIYIWAIALVMPYALRVLFYWVLAPVATRLPPIHIDSSETTPPVPEPSESAVSIQIEVNPGDELLVKSDFLQSSSQVADKQTQWLLNARFPFSSLAADLWALTRIRPRNGERTTVMVSCQQDALGEVGLVHLPAGSAMVVLPRSLAGVLKPSHEPVKMSRHWRHKSLHAWLTWQLRYLVLHGPCTLIVKGCRGIRAEAPSASSPRLIRQSATLAFSINLGYQTIRHATFVPYLRGQEDLFCDLFSGGPGLFVYEEMPTDSANGVRHKRGLEGIFDAVLKVFGI